MVINLSSMADPIGEDQTSAYFMAFHFDVTGFGSWRKSNNKKIENVIVSEYELSFLSKGRLRITTPDNEFLCESGSLFLFEPFTPYSVEKLYDGDMDLYNIFFDVYPAYRLSEFFQNLSFDLKPLWVAQELPELRRSFSDIFTLCDRSPQGKELLVDCLLKTCLVYMFRAARARRERLPSARLSSVEACAPSIIARQSVVVKAGIKYISCHLSEAIKLYDLCREINVSESYLYKCFINITHVSPQRYILQYKVKKAQQMFRFQGLSVEAVALSLGFSSSYHLSAVYKKILGKSPTKHIKEHGFF